MVIRLSVIALLVSLTSVLPLGNPGVAFAAEATISVSPASVQVRPGDDVAIDYLVGDVGPLPGIGGYVLSVRFDPAVLELVTLLDGGFVTGGDNVVICGPTAIDNDAGIGVLFCAAVPLFGAPGVSTTQPVVLARSLFRARAPGMSVIDLEGTYLQGPNSEAIASTLSNGSVTVSPREEQVAATATAAHLPDLVVEQLGQLLEDRIDCFINPLKVRPGIDDALSGVRVLPEVRDLHS